MAEIIESTNHETIPSNTKVNSALTLGIIGTALSGLTALGGIGNLAGVFNSGTSTSKSNQSQLTDEDVYLERAMAVDKLGTQKEIYEWKLQNLKNLTDAFFESYQRDVDNSFKLYKYTRDSNDALMSKIEQVDKKVDVMAAIRPYQDALIDQKMNTNAMIAEFNLARRTCKMIEGQLVLPSTPVVSGYGSYNPCACYQSTQTS